ncbi:hypothetical protein QFC19_009339 [Naganishia cerealis]|uniref:Uncharacterized protein n=1 Tax=Naganishia cerealis TaxID=610337 RepID=A0ACC2UW12_9TREE|nr:hypothetical protein QFC19_009339 [Naganishia cerealis]
MSSQSSSIGKNVHLAVLVHGLWGNPKHLDVAREELQLAYQRAQEQTQPQHSEAGLPKLRILVAQGNEGTYTYDGIDVCAARVAREIEKEIARIEKDGLLGRTGDQLYTWDQYSTQDERPLLEVMSDPDEMFIKALNSFQRIDFFANAVQDYTVPYPTGAINYDDPFVETPAKSSVEEEIVVETDDSGIIQRWYTVPIEDGVRKGNKTSPPGLARTSTSPHITSRARRPEASRALSTSKVKQKRMRLTAKRLRPPILPPFLVFPRPFNWIFYAATPLFMPVFMVGVVIAFIIDSGRSRRRAKAVAGHPLNKTIATAVALASRTSNESSGFSRSGTNSPDYFSDQRSLMQTHGAVDAVRMRLDSAARSMRNSLIRRTTGFDPEMDSDESDSERGIMLDSRRSSASSTGDESRRSSSAESAQTDMTTSSTLVNDSPPGGDDGLGAILSNIKHWPSNKRWSHSRIVNGSRSTKQDNYAMSRPPTSRMHSTVENMTEYKTVCEDKPYPHPAHDLSASPHRPDLTKKKDVKLQLTDVQRRIIRNLNEGIDETRWRKWLTWLPMVGNAHAAITVRDGRKFPEQEHGRGVLRRWAENTVMNEDRKA